MNKLPGLQRFLMSDIREVAAGGRGGGDDLDWDLESDSSWCLTRTCAIGVLVRAYRLRLVPTFSFPTADRPWDSNSHIYSEIQIYIYLQ